MYWHEPSELSANLVLAVFRVALYSFLSRTSGCTNSVFQICHVRFLLALPANLPQSSYVLASRVSSLCLIAEDIDGMAHYIRPNLGG